MDIRKDLSTKDSLSHDFIDDLNTLITKADRESPGVNLLAHSRNVGTYSKFIFENLPDYERKEWGNTNASQVYNAGKYHDIGKVFIESFHKGMLDKLKFDDIDRFNVQEHITGGTVILQAVASLNDITDINTSAYKMLMDACLYHHERTDGGGYLHVTGNSIPRIGSLVAVADCFSAGIEKRVYSDPKGMKEVLGELKELPLSQIYVNALEKALVVNRLIESDLVNVKDKGITP